MAFNAKTALAATQEVRLEHGGQTLIASVYISNLTPAQIKSKAEEAAKAARQAERTRLRLVRTLETAEAALLEAKPEDEEAAQKAVATAEDELDEFDREAMEKNIRYLSGDLASLLASWDVEYDGGEPVPITPDGIFESLPWPVISALHTKTQEAIRPGEANSTL